MASNSANEASDSDNENEKATEFFKPGFLLPKKEQEELLKREKRKREYIRNNMGINDNGEVKEKATEIFKPGFLLPKKQQEELLKREIKQIENSRRNDMMSIIGSKGKATEVVKPGILQEQEELETKEKIWKKNSSFCCSGCRSSNISREEENRKRVNSENNLDNKGIGNATEIFKPGFLLSRKEHEKLEKREELKRKKNCSFCNLFNSERDKILKIKANKETVPLSDKAKRKNEEHKTTFANKKKGIWNSIQSFHTSLGSSAIHP